MLTSSLNYLWHKCHPPSRLSLRPSRFLRKVGSPSCSFEYIFVDCSSTSTLFMVISVISPVPIEPVTLSAVAENPYGIASVPMVDTTFFRIFFWLKSRCYPGFPISHSPSPPGIVGLPMVTALRCDDQWRRPRGAARPRRGGGCPGDPPAAAAPGSAGAMRGRRIDPWFGPWNLWTFDEDTVWYLWFSKDFKYAKPYKTIWNLWTFD